MMPRALLRVIVLLTAAIAAATTQIHSPNKPAKILVNDRQDSTWSYDKVNQTATVHTTGTAPIQVWSN